MSCTAITRIALTLVLGVSACTASSDEVAPAPVETTAAPAQGTTPAFVVNTAANPIPIVATGTTAVSGSVAISGTPTVNATISGTRR